MNVGFLYSQIRADEKLLLTELRSRGHDILKIDVRKHQFSIKSPSPDFKDLDFVIDRCIAHSQSKFASMFFDSYDIPIVNKPAIVERCSDKIKTSLLLTKAGIPTPETTVAFSTESALETIESIGYPCEIKPVVGSWGRLMAKIDNRTAAEAIVEHKATLGHYEHKIFYIQKFINKPNRDIRVVAADGNPIAAMTRTSTHWLTNAAKGAQSAAYEIPDDVASLVEQASKAVGGGLLGVDLMELEEGGFTVHEINPGTEFKALNECVDVDVPSHIINWIESLVHKKGDIK